MLIKIITLMITSLMVISCSSQQPRRNHGKNYMDNLRGDYFIRF